MFFLLVLLVDDGTAVIGFDGTMVIGDEGTVVIGNYGNKLLPDDDGTMAIMIPWLLPGNDDTMITGDDSFMKTLDV